MFCIIEWSNGYYESYPRFSNITWGANDKKMKVKLFIDKEFIESSGKIGVHPNDNTATVWLKTVWLKIEDLINIIKEHGNEVEIVEI